MVPSAFTDVFAFHNLIFTKRSTMAPQIGPGGAGISTQLSLHYWTTGACSFQGQMRTFTFAIAWLLLHCGSSGKQPKRLLVSNRGFKPTLFLSADFLFSVNFHRPFEEDHRP